MRNVPGSADQFRGWFISARHLGGSKGGGTQFVQTPPQTTTNVVRPWDEAIPYLTDVMGRARSAADSTPTTPYSGPLSAAPTAAQRQGNQGIVNFAQNSSLPTLGNAAISQASDTLSGKYLDPSTNPALVPGIQATVRPIINNTRENVLPQLTSEAWNAGAYGGARHGLREAQVIRDTNQVVADTTSKAVLDNYQRERGLQFAAPGLAQQGTSLAVAPSQMLSQAGAEQQGWEQQTVQDEMQRYNNSVSAPWQAVQPYASIISGLGLPNSSTTTGTGLQAVPSSSMGSSILGGALGGGSLAYGLSQAFPSSLGFLGPAAGPWGIAGGAVLGGLLGLL